MTGTAREVSAELKSTYDLQVLRIPTYKSPPRLRWPDRCFGSDAQRWQAVLERAAAPSQLGRAVLVGTRSVQASETLSHLLTQHAIAHTVLNAHQDKAEAQAVAKAGEAGQITVATNMAGRGTDIKLASGVNEAGGATCHTD